VFDSDLGAISTNVVVAAKAGQGLGRWQARPGTPGESTHAAATVAHVTPMQKMKSSSSCPFFSLVDHLDRTEGTLGRLSAAPTQQSILLHRHRLEFYS
jgi:hypothetical protein